MEWTKIITAIIAIASFMFTIFKTYREFGSKREISDLEQLMKFLSHEKQEDFKKQPAYIKDAFCQTVSFLKGHSFEEIEILINNKEIKLTELQNLLSLKKINVITYDKQEKKFKEVPNKYPKFKIFLNYLFIFLAALLAIILVHQYGVHITTVAIACIIIGIVEIPALLRIDKIKSAQRYKENGLNNFLQEQSKIIKDI